ncbi:MAG: DEAD/DEAH box helicase [Bacteroidota bacterium]
MKVYPNAPFEIIYSMYEHQYLGYLFEPFVVQLNAKGDLTLQTQNIWSKNAKEFSSGLNDVDFQLIKWMDAIQQEVVAKKFSQKKTKSDDFFLKVYDTEKGDKLIQESIGDYLVNLKSQILKNLLKNKRLFVMSQDGDPIRTEIEILPKAASTLFHFMRNEENTHYFPTIKYEGQKVDFQYKNALIINDEPAWMLLENKLYHFEHEVDGKKLKPFLHKKFILVPKNIEESYYQKFVMPLITMFDVHAKGFEIKTERFKPIPIINLSEVKALSKVSFNLFGEPVEDTEIENEESTVSFSLMFQYGSQSFRFDSFSSQANVSMDKKEDSYLFHKIIRELSTEKHIISYLKSIGLDLKNGRISLPKIEAFNWVQTHFQALNEAGILIEQNAADPKKYFIGLSSIDISLSENKDWFDILAKVKFGEFEIPFIKLKNVILSKKKEFELPNGEIAVIPEIWFTQYSELFAFAEIEPDHESLILKKHHFQLVQSLENESLAKVLMSRKLEKLSHFEKIEEKPLPKKFVGTLRPYQKAGYDWMRFLQDFNLGGCLADDMGLGKTVQTLALLQSQKEAKVEIPSLLVMPTSLVYNWELETKKFTPDLKVLLYTGTNRDKNIDNFAKYDIIITSYGIVRIDLELIKNFRFNYIILDESQSIKNPTSNIAKAVMQLNSFQRLILTGTPLENSTLDLWTQMTFINPGLLGSHSYFRNEFLIPIEKKSDDSKLRKLNLLIKPFIMRRHKSQVATELPPKVEAIHYCYMTDEQEKAYETAKSYYRNIILQAIDNKGINNSQIILLQGLTKLRQIANHPKMVDEAYEGDSGKMEDILSKIETATDEGHKVLVFSQFVKHLNIVRENLDEKLIKYAYLDGSTLDRQSQVELFQNDSSIKLFLISLKAGGLGLNLTAADYVFILDPWWNPAIEAQAIDRAHRIGQVKTVFTYKYISKNTVEEKILALQKGKLKLANSLINTEETFVKSLSKEDILVLLE